MQAKHSWRRGLFLAFVLAALALWCQQQARAAIDEPIKVLKLQAQHYEKLGDWGAAADKYEQILRLDRHEPGIRDRYQHCLRRYFQVVRFRDSSYKKEVLTLKFPQAISLYEEVLATFLSHPLYKDKVSPALLFQKGLEEFNCALVCPEFCQDQLSGTKPERTRRLREDLQAEFGLRKTMTYEDAIDTLRKVVVKSINHYPKLNATAVVMEFLCGACHGMDEYTIYLTPRQLRELCDSLKGRYVGIGVRLKVDQNNKLLVAEVLPDSPATEINPPLAKEDQIVSIDGKLMLDMTPEAAMELLEGDEGTVIQIGVQSATQDLRIVTLRRRALFVPSVSAEIQPSTALNINIGYIKVHCFQESTPQEFEAKLAELLKADCKALILDLRGNPGGLLDVAVDLARRFLPTGVIVTKQHMNPKLSRVEESNNPAALGIPLVVLVDGDTASAAEVLAGALKENKRATTIGQTTYGKGCSQGLLDLEAALHAKPPLTPGGIRVTVSRFYSPTGQPYSGRGMDPDIFADTSMQMYHAQKEAERLLMGM